MPFPPPDRRNITTIEAAFWLGMILGVTLGALGMGLIVWLI